MKSKKLNFEDEEADDSWDAWEDEEADDIIDDEEEEEEVDAIEEDPSSKQPRKKKKRGGGGIPKTILKWTYRTGVVVLVLILLFAPWGPLEAVREKTGIDSLKDLMRPYMKFPEWVNVTMTINYNIDIDGGRVDTMRIQVAPPFDIPFENDTEPKSYVLQDVLDVTFQPENTVPLMDYDREQNRISGWEINDERGPRIYLKVTYDLTLHAHKWKVSEEDSGVISDIPKFYTDRYLGQDWMVDLNNDDIPDKDRYGNDLYRYDPKDENITRIAQDLTKDEETVYGKVKAIYDYMQEEFTYTTAAQREADKPVYKDYPKWATGCLADGYGDCDDQSLLMASLCRAVDIPAWLEIGYLYDPNQGTWGGHGWFNVAIPVKDDEGVLLEDPVVAPIDPVNHEFLFRDPYRITDWIDDGGHRTVPGKDTPVFNLDYYYNYFSVTRPGHVDVSISQTTDSDKYEEHGSLKIYSDEKLDPGNLPGTQQQLDLPTLSPLLVMAPISLLLIAIPIGRSFRKRI